MFLSVKAVGTTLVSLLKVLLYKAVAYRVPQVRMRSWLGGVGCVIHRTFPVETWVSVSFVTASSDEFVSKLYNVSELTLN